MPCPQAAQVMSELVHAAPKVGETSWASSYWFSQEFMSPCEGRSWHMMAIIVAMLAAGADCVIWLAARAKTEASPCVMAGVRAAVSACQRAVLRAPRMTWLIWSPVTFWSGSDVPIGEVFAEAIRSRTCCTPFSTSPLSGQSAPVWPAWQAST